MLTTEKHVRGGRLKDRILNRSARAAQRIDSCRSCAPVDAGLLILNHIDGSAYGPCFDCATIPSMARSHTSANSARQGCGPTTTAGVRVSTRFERSAVSDLYRVLAARFVVDRSRHAFAHILYTTSRAGSGEVASYHLAMPRPRFLSVCLS